MLYFPSNPCSFSFSNIRTAEYGASSSHRSTCCLYSSSFVGFGAVSVYSGFCGDSAYRLAVRRSMWYFFPNSVQLIPLSLSFRSSFHSDFLSAPLFWYGISLSFIPPLRQFPINFLRRFLHFFSGADRYSRRFHRRSSERLLYAGSVPTKPLTAATSSLRAIPGTL